MKEKIRSWITSESTKEKIRSFMWKAISVIASVIILILLGSVGETDPTLDMETVIAYMKDLSISGVQKLWPIATFATILMLILKLFYMMLPGMNDEKEQDLIDDNSLITSAVQNKDDEIIEK